MKAHFVVWMRGLACSAGANPPWTRVCEAIGLSIPAHAPHSEGCTSCPEKSEGTFTPHKNEYIT
eukprot:235023-Amphidinium_carterae.1